ncbi:RNA polymerase sigma70 factor [Flavihumibacter solisilvae]|uniref:RNA polymerase sigma70 factor n=1 Tax=Flavihumibacter solisilvae TaxID=1349421 RepID=A0A0C1IGI1_9BACT|nr:RNA polymerase sigma70 factor [Flavihumibacter solisilvae]
MPGTDSTDEELVDVYRHHGDLQALATLYNRYMDLVFGVCLKYLEDRETSKDAVMNIFEELVVKLKKHEVDNFRSWVYTVAKNHCLMYLRSNKQLKTVELPESLVQSAENPHLNGKLQQEEHFRLLEKCLQALAIDQQQAVRMFYLDEKSYKEISDSTGMDWNRVRSLIQNGRRNLKNCMDKNS